MDGTYRWLKRGDANAFFALMLDNVLNLVVLTGILVGFGFPIERVLTLMVPGTALGVMVGDVAYSFLAMRLAKKTGNPNVTAMPLGLDTPSTIGIALMVLGPAFLAAKGDLVAGGMAQDAAANQAAFTTWQLGMAVMVTMGVVKVIFAFFGDWIRRVVPTAGLLGSLGGIGLALLAYFPLVDVFEAPIIGLSALGLVLYTLVARIDLPWQLPGAAVAVLVGTVLHYALGPIGYGVAEFAWPTLELHLGFPMPSTGFIEGFRLVGPYLPIAIPFGLLTVIGGINVTESARLAGDAYRTRDILLIDAASTFLAGVFGGVSQSTPYIGHPAYKAMGASAGYTLFTGVFVGLGGMLGYVQFVVELIPKAAVTPILLFIGLEIVHQAYHQSPRRHSPAVTLAFLPIVARLGSILIVPFVVGATLSEGAVHSQFILAVLGNGFIITAMLWGAALALLIDRQLVRSGIFFLVIAGLTAVGIIHSVDPQGSLYLPWAAGEHAHHMHLMVIGYAMVGAALTAVGLSGAVKPLTEAELAAL
ncbi:MAG: hypothetical protein JXX28_12865 [Deltaproteobacteria bacterium]|nr:hypothetical protein [Deltaproteobacteria bacterium]